MFNHAPPRHRGSRTWLATLLLFVLAGPATARDFKCWKGSDGEMQCGEVMPPGQGNLPATVYDGRGRRVSGGTAAPDDQAPDTAPEQTPRRRPPSPSEADRTLLLTFPALTDLTAARDHEVAAIDTLIQTEQRNVRGQETVLNRLRTQAADLERSGRPVPHELLDKIDQADKSLRQSRATEDLRTQEKQAILHAYALKIERFRHLKGLSDSTAAAPADRAAGPDPSTAGTPAPGRSAPTVPAPGPPPAHTAAADGTSAPAPPARSGSGR